MKKTIIAMLALSGVAFGAQTATELNDSLEEQLGSYEKGHEFTLTFTFEYKSGDGISGQVMTLVNGGLGLRIESAQFIGFNQGAAGIEGSIGSRFDANANDLELSANLTGWVYDSGAFSQMNDTTVTIGYDGEDSFVKFNTYGNGVESDVNGIREIKFSYKGSLFDANEFKFVDGSGALTGTQGIGSVTFQSSSPIPEPTTATLSLLALAGLAARRRRK